MPERAPVVPLASNCRPEHAGNRGVAGGQLQANHEVGDGRRLAGARELLRDELLTHGVPLVSAP
jgi:hypothetical protein